MEDFKPVRVDPADKTRCQAVDQRGEQCPFQGMPDPTITPGVGGMAAEDVRFLKFCRMHGSIASKAMKKEAKRCYALGRWKDKVEKMLDPDVGTNLDEELGILRMMLELMLGKYEEMDLLNNVSGVSAIIRDIRELLKDNKKLKSQMGELMDRAAIQRLCDTLVIIISKHVPVDKLDEVGADVAAAIADAVAKQHDA